MEKKNVALNVTATVVDIDDEGNEVEVSKKMTDMTAKEIKEYQRKKLEEARKADAEKYGDEDIPDLPPLEEEEDSDSVDEEKIETENNNNNNKNKKNKKIK